MAAVIPIPIKRNDTHPPITGQVLKKNGEPQPLDDVVNIYFSMRVKGAALDVDPVIYRVCEITDVELGKFQFLWEDGDTDTTGKYEFEFKLDWGDGIQTLPPKGFFLLDIWDDAGVLP